jgi:Ca2+/H+ antiporter
VSTRRRSRLRLGLAAGFAVFALVYVLLFAVALRAGAAPFFCGTLAVAAFVTTALGVYHWGRRWDA